MTGLPFDGLNVLVTGVIGSMSRQNAQKAIADLGGKAAASVTGKVNLVVLGDGAGLSKSQKARDLGIPVISGATFADLVTDPSTWDGQPLGMTFEEFETLNPADDDDDEPVLNIPMAQRHLVTKIVYYPTVDERGRGVREINLSCQCGHKWLGTRLDEFTCPHADQPITPPTAAFLAAA